MSSTGRFPVSCKELSTLIQGVPTDIVISSYDDYIFVMATQSQRMGTLIHARKEESFGFQPTFNVRILLGKRDEPLIVACARQLIEQISNAGSTRPLLLSLGLKNHSPGSLRELATTIAANKIW